MPVTVSEYNTAIKQWGPQLMRFVNYSLRNTDATKDITQDSFLVLWEKRDSVQVTQIKQFLFTVAHRKMINYIKSMKPGSSIEEHSEMPIPANQESYDNKQAVEELVSKLPLVQKEILLLRDIEGYSYKEIQDITSLNESQIKVYLYRARLLIKQLISKEITVTASIENNRK